MGWLDKQIRHASKSIRDEVHHIGRGVSRIEHKVVDGVKEAEHKVSHSVHHAIKGAEHFGSKVEHEIKHEAKDILKEADHIGSAVVHEIKDIPKEIESGLEHLTDKLPTILGGSKTRDDETDYMSLGIIAASGIGGFIMRNNGQYLVGNMLIGAAAGGGIVDLGEYAAGSIPGASWIESFDFVKRSEKSSLYIGMAAGAAVGAGVSLLGQVGSGVRSDVINVAQSEQGKQAISSAGNAIKEIAPLAAAALIL